MDKKLVFLKKITDNTLWVVAAAAESCVGPRKWKDILDWRAYRDGPPPDYSLSCFPKRENDFALSVAAVSSWME